MEDKLKASSAWSDSDDIFTPKTGDHLTPAEKLSADLEALFSKTIAAKPVGQKIDLSDVSRENTILAGLDEIALDSYCLKFLNLQAKDVPYLSIGEKRGLGVVEWKSLDYVELKV